MNVADLMTPEPVVVTEATSIAECAHLLSSNRFRHLPVVDDKGRLSGVVTDFGVFRLGGLAGVVGELWVPFEPETVDLKAADLAEPAKIVAKEDDDLESLLGDLCADPQDMAVIVNDKHHPIGVITEHDGVRYAQGLGKVPVSAGQAATRPIVTVQSGDQAQVAWTLMTEHKVRHVAVLDAEEGSLVGVISYRDLIEDDVARGRDLTCYEVIRNEETLTIAPEAPLHEAAVTMAMYKYGCLPVMAPGEKAPEAMLTRVDLIQAAIQSLQDEQLFDSIH